MTAEEAAHIKSFDKCDFTNIHKYFKDKSEVKKQLSKEEKQVSVMFSNRTFTVNVYDIILHG